MYEFYFNFRSADISKIAPLNTKLSTSKCKAASEHIFSFVLMIWNLYSIDADAQNLTASKNTTIVSNKNSKQIPSIFFLFQIFRFIWIRPIKRHWLGTCISAFFVLQYMWYLSFAWYIFVCIWGFNISAHTFLHWRSLCVPPSLQGLGF